MHTLMRYINEIRKSNIMKSKPFQYQLFYTNILYDRKITNFYFCGIQQNYDSKIPLLLYTSDTDYTLEVSTLEQLVNEQLNKDMSIVIENIKKKKEEETKKIKEKKSSNIFFPALNFF